MNQIIIPFFLVNFKDPEIRAVSQSEENPDLYRLQILTENRLITI